MRSLRYLFCILAAALAGGAVLYGIGQSGLAGEQGISGGIYTNLVIYPAGIIAAAIAFWIVWAATDPGSEK